MNLKFIFAIVFVAFDGYSLANDDQVIDEFSSDDSITEALPIDSNFDDEGEEESKQLTAKCDETRIGLCDRNHIIYVNKTVKVAEDLLIFFYYDNQMVSHYMKIDLNTNTEQLLIRHEEVFPDWNLYNSTTRVEDLDSFISAFSLRPDVGAEPDLNVFYILPDENASIPYLTVLNVQYDNVSYNIKDMTKYPIDPYRFNPEVDTFQLHKLFAHFPSQLQRLARPVIAFPLNDPELPNRLLVYFFESNPRNATQFKQMVHIFVDTDMGGQIMWAYDRKSGQCLLLPGDRVQAAVAVTDMLTAGHDRKKFYVIEFYANGEFGVRKIETVGEGRQSVITAFSFDAHNIKERIPIRNLLHCHVCSPTTANLTETTTTLTETSTRFRIPSKEKNERKVWLWVLIVIIILLIIGGVCFAVYWFVYRGSSSSRSDWDDPGFRGEDIEMAERGEQDMANEPSPRTPTETPDQDVTTSPPTTPKSKASNEHKPPPHSTPSTPRSRASSSSSSSSKSQRPLELNKPDKDIPFVDE